MEDLPPEIIEIILRYLRVGNKCIWWKNLDSIRFVNTTFFSITPLLYKSVFICTRNWVYHNFDSASQVRQYVIKKYPNVRWNAIAFAKHYERSWKYCNSK